MTTLDVAELYRQHRVYVVRYLLRRGCSREVAEDLTQDVFVRALRSGTYADQGKPGAWLTTIARNALTDHLRSAAVRRSVAVDLAEWDELSVVAMPQPTGVEDAVVRQGWLSDARRVLDSALAGLTEPQRQVLRLRFLAELNVAQTAQAMGRKVGAAKAMQTRACQALARDPQVQALRAQAAVA